MKRYLVTVPLYGIATVEVEARNERDAVSFAVDEVEAAIIDVEVTDDVGVEVTALMAYDDLYDDRGNWMGDGDMCAVAKEIDE
jgi:hypothetical protein